MAVDNSFNQRAFPSSFREFIFNVDGTNLAEGDCPQHGPGHFERVFGNLFQCANKDHWEVTINLSLANKPSQVFDR